VTGSAPLPAVRSGRVAWQLAQTLWVGGAWMLHFVLLPALERFGLAPFLVEEIGGFMRPLVACFAATCALLQGLICWNALGSRWWRDTRGQVLALVLLSAVVHLAASWWLAVDYWAIFSFLLLCFSGLVLVLQPRPDETAH